MREGKSNRRNILDNMQGIIKARTNSPETRKKKDILLNPNRYPNMAL